MEEKREHKNGYQEPQMQVVVLSGSGVETADVINASGFPDNGTHI